MIRGHQNKKKGGMKGSDTNVLAQNRDDNEIRVGKGPFEFEGVTHEDQALQKGTHSRGWQSSQEQCWVSLTTP